MTKRKNIPARYEIWLKIKKFGLDKNIIMHLYKKCPSLNDLRTLPQLVKNFDNLNDEDKSRAEGIAEDMFSKGEVSQIFPFFCSLPNTEFCCTIAKTPKTYPGGQFVSHKDLPMGTGLKSHIFDKKNYSNYPLNFKINAWYDSEAAFYKELDIKMLKELKEKRKLNKKTA